MFRRCTNPQCKRPFQINRFNASLSRVTQAGRITCPHCGLMYFADAASIFLTHALSEAEEAEFQLTEERQVSER